ncbi:MAG: acetyl-CoA carboxylase, carboxyltransferase subunit beta [Candidatus Neomarinimicrobiota bacterium]
MVAWFKRDREKLQTAGRKSIPDGLWEKCRKCEEILYARELAKALWVCPHCHYHFRLRPADYMKMLLDDGKFEELNPGLKSGDPLHFKARKKYTEQLESAMAKSGTLDVLSTVQGSMDHRSLVLCIMTFDFIGGSMGSVVGEKLSRAIDHALNSSLPLVTISASGGARMQEGIYSLMQMAKTSAKLARFSESGGMHVSILTDPTTGGVTASYAMLGDIILAEPGALIGFAGPRVIKQTIGEDLPEGFQRAEFLLEKGFVDRIVHRKEMKEVLGQILDFAHG